MASVSHMMRPQNQRSTRTPDRGAKDYLGPAPVADNGIEPTPNEYLLETASRSPYRNRIADPYCSEVVECHALANQLRFKPAAEAQSELRRHVRAQVTIAR